MKTTAAKALATALSAVTALATTVITEAPCKLSKAGKPSSQASMPICSSIGTRSEGWDLPDGSHKFANCAGFRAVCAKAPNGHPAWIASRGAPTVNATKTSKTAH